LPVPADIPENLAKPSAVFVSLKKGGSLRGCIGTLEPTRTTAAEEIIENALSAAFQDPRFQPLDPSELNSLEISVDILSASEPVTSEAELDPAIYGCIVEAGRRRGLLLPDLPGVDTPAEQVDICRQKGGIDLGERVSLRRFTVTRYT